MRHRPIAGAPTNVASWYSSACLRGRLGEAWPALLALVRFPAGALIAAACAAGDLAGDGRAADRAVLAVWPAAALSPAWAAVQAEVPSATT